MRSKNPNMKMKNMQTDDNTTNYERYVERLGSQQAEEMYIGSVMCWGTVKKSFFTQGEEQFTPEFCSFDSSSFMVKNGKNDFITLNVIFAEMFKIIHENCYHIATIRYFCGCPQSDEEQGQKFQRKEIRKVGERSVSKFRAKKQIFKTETSISKIVKVRIDISFKKNFFSQNSRDYLQKITLLGHKKEEAKLKLKQKIQSSWTQKNEIRDLEASIHAQRCGRAFLLYFIEKTHVQIINRSFIKPPPRLNEFLRTYKKKTIGIKSKDQRCQRKVQAKITKWKASFSMMNNIYHCCVTENDLQDYYKILRQKSLLWGRYQTTKADEISIKEIQKIKIKSNHPKMASFELLRQLNPSSEDFLTQNLKEVLSQIGGTYFLDDQESDDDDEEQNTNTKISKNASLSVQDRELSKKNQMLMQKFQYENKHFREHETPFNMISQLKPYQKQALQWMKYRQGKIPVEDLFTQEYVDSIEELDFERKLSPYWEEVKLIGNQHFYINYLKGEISTEFHDWKSIKGGILADQMGLGKTVMMLALLADENYYGLNLVVVPVTVVRQWFEQIKKHCGEHVKVLEYNSVISTKRHRIDLSEYNIVIVSYATLGAEYKAFSKLEGPTQDRYLFDYKFRRVILDEAHNIKNSDTLYCKGAIELTSDYVWCLTGTLVQNSINDLFAIFKFLKIEVFSQEYWWNMYIKNTNSFTQKINVIQTVLRPIVLRRTKQSTSNEGKNILELTKKNVTLVRPSFSEVEKTIYQRLQKGVREYFKINTNHGKEYTHVFQIIGKLRQFCCHASMIFKEGIEDLEEKDLETYLSSFLEKKNEEYKKVIVSKLDEDNQVCGICLQQMDDSDLVLTNCGHIYCQKCIKRIVAERRQCSICRSPLTSQRSYKKKTELMGGYNQKYQEQLRQLNQSSKEKAVMKIVEEVRERKEKCVIFTQWTKMIEIIGIRLMQAKIGFETIQGTMTIMQRQKALRAFKTDQRCQLLIVSIRAGATGLNLVNANNLIVVDPWWNPAQEEQAIARVHRIGQEKDVNIYKIVMKNSIEERIIKMHERKTEVASQVMMQKENSDQKKATTEILNLLFDGERN